MRATEHGRSPRASNAGLAARTVDVGHTVFSCADDYDRTSRFFT